MDLKIGDGTLKVNFNDWMFLQPSGVLVNRARVTKFGIEIGQVTLFFKKESLESENVSQNTNSPLDSVSSKILANQ